VARDHPGTFKLHVPLAPYPPHHLAKVPWQGATLPLHPAFTCGYRFFKFRMPLLVRAAQREVGSKVPAALEQMLADVDSERALPKTFGAIKTEFAKAATAMPGRTKC
jgi:hypothetical protein